MRDKIEAKLKLALRPESIRVEDESAKHAGHIERHGHADPDGDTHFRVWIVSDMFAGKSRVECHRMITDLLAEEFDAGLHALAIHSSTPAQSA
ncbi:BolA protein [Rhodobium orientis]|nr:BolA family protein [Rhodobium orientis]MBB4305672.1 BolA protein [Rhodobium orientis]